MITLKTSNSKKSYDGIYEDIANINQIFIPYGLKVSEVIEASQVIRYVINLPLDIKLQGKIRRATKDIEYTLISALRSDEIIYKHEEDKLIIERRGEFNILPFGNLFTKSFLDNTDGLMLMLGQDLNGKAIYTDLAKAPHILIAGTTGSGKSETIHTIIASLLMRYCYGHNAPGIGIIDIKGTEFNKYQGTYPITIVKDAENALKMLQTFCTIMDNRYKILADANCDDIQEYRQKGNRMQSLVCIIDELADLMLQNPDVEKYIVRIAQKARACGIHLVIGTQSPRADVVTGLIKANIPFKIALNTSTSIESRIIIDTVGAEKLLGKGDMLIKKGGNKPIRAQGCYVYDDDKIALAKEATNGQHYEIMPASNPQPTIRTTYNTQPIFKDTPSYYSQPTYKPQNNSYNPKQYKKPGFFQGLKNLWDAPSNTTPQQFINIISHE